MGADNPVMYICRAIKQNNSVIHVGAVGTNPRKQLVRHKKYKKAAGKIIGFDYDKKLVANAKKDGCGEIFVADVTDNEQMSQIIKNHGVFKHVIATEVIEHVGNLTLMLDNIYRLMHKEGTLYLTTPNVASPGIQNMFSGRKKLKVNPDHICWFEIVTLTELLKRSKLKPRKTMDLRRTLYMEAEKIV